MKYTPLFIIALCDAHYRNNAFLDGEMLKDVSNFSREELELACEDFSNIIGSSPDSVVYKGTMMNGPEIAVISLCILKDQWTDYLELYFHNKVLGLKYFGNLYDTKGLLC